MVNYDMHTLRLNSQYDTRVRRAFDRFAQAVDDLNDRLIVVEAGSVVTVDAATVDVNGTTSETVSDPTAMGQWLIRNSNKITSAGTHTVNLSAVLPSSSTVTALDTSAASSSFVCVSGKYLDNWVWYITTNAGWNVT